eukprot:CAMPEP_0113327022 /NCGR_PEP_ID=MMETSP0010_2-20120614/18979_1 /TAXON_ID=216773 ORGANISM="Corethron hystrix, Strain 308" /NCGR_SAMPLE_ID=MMETSP0010_2 /ASSEMBLY_ACC=CAM_ASM_000155 /LENGTH=83 /DNA_ID=CAMNT_0000187685 /DNA_START=109 /DNA_END=357 /DNA_ORIENTATION=+ /assembly_acc=CAM_ASM_000155
MSGVTFVPEVTGLDIASTMPEEAAEIASPEFIATLSDAAKPTTARAAAGRRTRSALGVDWSDVSEVRLARRPMSRGGASRIGG